MAIYFDVTRAYLTWRGYPTGIQRSVYGFCAAAVPLGIRPVAFHPRERRWFPVGNIAASARPLRRNRLWDYASVERLRALKRSGPPIDFASHDSLYLLDANITSISNYARAVETMKKRDATIAIVGFIHDIIPILYPDLCPTAFRRGFKSWLAFLKEYGDRFVTNSREVALSATPHFPGKTITPIRFGSEIDSCVPLKLHSTRDTWIVSVGVLDKRKNHTLLLDALEPLWESGALRIPLRIVGRFASAAEHLRARIASSSALRRHVALMGSIPDETLWDLYRGARLSLFPSRYEGFGLPVSESLQLHCPCFASNAGGIPEVAGNSVEYFDPTDARRLRELVSRFFADAEFESDLRARAVAFKPHTWFDAVQDVVAPQMTPHAPRHAAGPTEAIDVVYTWCDASDPNFSSELARFRSAKGSSEGALPQRFRNRDELRYALRSLETFAPWFGNVYLVTNGQTPTWLERAHPRLRVITHREIFEDGDGLPTFNSLAIETHLHRIPGLSEYFIYSNDDFFFGNSVPLRSYFSSAGRPVFYVDRFQLAAPMNAVRNLMSRIRGEDLMMRCHRYNHRLLIETLRAPLDARDPSHVPQLYRRSLLAMVADEWRSAVTATNQSRFRAWNNAKVSVLYPCFTTASPKVDRLYVLRTLRNGSGEYIFKTIRDRDIEMLPRWMAQILEARPTFLCVNDAVESESFAERAGQLIQDMLARYFPEPSSFEVACSGNERGLPASERSCPVEASGCFSRTHL